VDARVDTVQRHIFRISNYIGFSAGMSHAGGITLDDAESALMEKEGDSSFKLWAKEMKYKACTPQFWAVCISVWAVFTFIMCLFTYGFMKFPMMCIATDLFILVVAGTMLIWEYTAAKGITTVTLIPISVGVIISVFLATFLGLYCHDTYEVFPQYYDNSRKYSNVVASEPSAAISDAGKILFNPQTRVDTSKSAGLISEFGEVYCVAPVFAPSVQPRIEYWAAGINCCAQSGSFSCDQANNPDAAGGVVVFDNNGWFAPSRFQYYQKARAKAEATFSLQSVGHPLYIRWVDNNDLNYLHDYYSRRALALIIVCSLLAFIACFLYAGNQWKPL
jgi:hypothetical protein